MVATGHFLIQTVAFSFPREWSFVMLSWDKKNTIYQDLYSI